MSFVETWSVLKLSRRPVFFNQENIISDVEWKYSISDNGYTWEKTGRCLLGAPDATVIPFEDLTEEQVISWVQNALGFDFIRDLYIRGTAYLINQQGFTATTVTTMPWDSV
jgi:hypothetical protein